MNDLDRELKRRLDLGELTCARCRRDIASTATACAGCGAVMHRACARAGEACPGQGCTAVLSRESCRPVRVGTSWLDVGEWLLVAAIFLAAGIAIGRHEPAEPAQFRMRSALCTVS